jgi:hypothetical protein
VEDGLEVARLLLVRRVVEVTLDVLLLLRRVAAAEVDSLVGVRVAAVVRVGVAVLVVEVSCRPSTRRRSVGVGDSDHGKSCFAWLLAPPKTRAARWWCGLLGSARLGAAAEAAMRAREKRGIAVVGDFIRALGWEKNNVIDD